MSDDFLFVLLTAVFQMPPYNNTHHNAGRCNQCDMRAQADMMTAAMSPLNTGMVQLCDRLTPKHSRRDTSWRGRREDRGRRDSRSRSRSGGRRHRSRSYSRGPSRGRSRSGSRGRHGRDYGRARRSQADAGPGRDQAMKEMELKHAKDIAELRLGFNQSMQAAIREHVTTSTANAAHTPGPPLPPVPPPAVPVSQRTKLQAVIDFVRDASALGGIAAQRAAFRSKLMEAGTSKEVADQMKDIATMSAILMEAAMKQ